MIGTGTLRYDQAASHDSVPSAVTIKRFVKIAATVKAERNLSPGGSAQMVSITWTLLFTILLLIAIAVLGHTVWHGAVLAVMNVLTQFFTGGHAVG